MAANIEFNSNRNTYSFYSLKDVPWHGLGTVVEESKTPDEIIRIANMDYEVALAPMFASFIPAEAKHIVKKIITMLVICPMVMLSLFRKRVLA